jgi:LAO/AO transport system kinase
VNALALAFRAQSLTVGIIAVDPTSPFSGGAILGDRVRMRDLAGDAGVFIRSMATRGSLGGLARATRSAIHVLDAAGFDIILVETVGAGQSEIEIARIAPSVIVVEAPGMGDDVQAIKAGILEIADVLVVNKADQPGAAEATRALQAMLQLGHPQARERLLGMPSDSDRPIWMPPVVQTVAPEGTGINDLVGALSRHQQYMVDHGILERLNHQQIEMELFASLQTALLNDLRQAVSREVLEAIIARVQARELSPQYAVQEILELSRIHDYDQASQNSRD